MKPVVGHLTFGLISDSLGSGLVDITITHKKPSTMLKPTLGDIVLYRLTPGQCEMYATSGQCPGVVTKIMSESCVNLRLLIDGPNTPHIINALLGDSEGQWQWRDVQKPTMLTFDTSDMSDTRY